MNLILVILPLGLLSMPVSSFVMGDVPKVTARRYQYRCPSFKGISPVISLSPFEVRSDSSNGMHQEHYLTVIQVSLKMFSKLGMMVLPSNELCIIGQKMDRIILPNDHTSQFEIMIGIAIWFSPCIHRTTQIKRKSCLTRQMKKFNSLELHKINTFSKFLTKFIENN